MDDNEERLAWILEHWVEKRIETEVERIFQRLNYYLLSSTFLLAAFAAVAASTWDGSLSTLGARLAWSILTAGLSISLIFWAINSWNSDIVDRYRSWLDGKGDKVKSCGDVACWISGKQAIEDLGAANAVMKKGFEGCIHTGEYGLGELLNDLTNPMKPAWFARFIPAVVLLLWVLLGVASWQFGLAPSQPADITFVVIAVVLAFVVPIGVCLLARSKVRPDKDEALVGEEDNESHLGVSAQALLAKELTVAVLSRTNMPVVSRPEEMVPWAKLGVEVYRTIMAGLRHERQQSAQHCGPSGQAPLV